MVKNVQSSSKFIEIPAEIKAEVAQYLNGKELALLLGTSKNSVKLNASMQLKINESRDAQALIDSKIARAREKLIQVADKISNQRERLFYTRINQALAVVGSLGSMVADQLKGGVLLVTTSALTYMFSSIEEESEIGKIRDLFFASMPALLSTGGSTLAPLPITVLTTGLVCYNNWRIWWRL